MARRNGIPTIYVIARRLCQLLNMFAPGLTVEFSENTALLAALVAAQAACATLATEANKVRNVEQYP